MNANKLTGTIASARLNLQDSDIPDLLTTKIVGGTFDVARIPLLSTAQITSGTAFPVSFIPALSSLSVSVSVSVSVFVSASASVSASVSPAPSLSLSLSLSLRQSMRQGFQRPGFPPLVQSQPIIPSSVWEEFSHACTTWPDRHQPRVRQTDKQTNRHTDTQTHRDTDTQTHRHTDTQTDRACAQPGQTATSHVSVRHPRRPRCRARTCSTR